MKHIIKIILLGSAVSLAAPVRGDSSELGHLGVVEVRGERFPRLSAGAGVSVETLTRRELVHPGMPQLGSIMDKKLGMQVHYAGPGGISGLSVRGISGGQTNNKVALYLDGAPAATMRRGFLLESLDPDTIKRIDIYRGPASALFGAGSLAGAVNVISDTGHLEETRIDLMSGSFGSRRVSASLSRRSGNTGYSFASSYYDTRGHENNPATMVNLSASSEILAERNLFSFTARGFYSERDIPLYSPGTGEFLEKETGREHLLGLFRAGWRRDYRRSSLSLRAYCNTERESSSILEKEDAATLGGIAEWNITGEGGGRLFAGAELSREEFSGDLTETRSGYSPYIQGHLPLEDWDISAGLRYRKTEDFDGIFTPHITLRRRILKGVLLSAGYGSGFRYPTVAERFSRNLRLFGDPDLKPERSENLEAGISYENPRVEASVNVFTARVKDMIVSREPETPFTYEGNPVRRALMNIDSEARYRGVEFSGELLISGPLKLFLGYTYLDPGDLTFHTTRHTLRASLSISGGRHRFSAASTGRFGRYIFDGRQGGMEDLILLGADYTLRVTPAASVYASVENITDKSYTLYFREPMPGRRVSVGARAEF